MSLARYWLSVVGASAMAFCLMRTMDTRAMPADREADAADAPTPLDETALGVVLRANCNEVPANGEEFMRVLRQVGDFAQLPVPFSAVAMSSGLTNPRVVIAPTLRSHANAAKPADEADDDPKVVPPAPVVPPAVAPFAAMVGRIAKANQQPHALSTTALDRPNLEGRLFFAANMDHSFRNAVYVKAIEFISWNSRKKRFDFGVIEYASASGGPEIKFLDGIRCFSCHKNKGPILGSGPWSNTTHNDVVRAAAISSLQRMTRPQRPGMPNKKDPIALARFENTFDGVSLAIGEPEDVDAAVRLGSDLVRDRAIYRAMLKSADGRQAFYYLLSALVDPQPLDRAYQQVKQPLDQAFNINFANFGNDVVAIHATSSSVLQDYNPAGSMGTLKTSSGRTTGWGRGSSLPPRTTLEWGSTTDKVIAYDVRRAGGDPAIASGKQPSSTKAFIRTPTAVPPSPSAAVSAVVLARTIGLTEADRAFLIQTLSEVAKRIGKPKVTTATLAKQVFSGPSFAEHWKAADIPDRDEFKDRFIKGLTAILAEHQLAGGLTVDRREYGSGPRILNKPGQDDRETDVVPTTSCLRCHDVQGVGRPAFNPIPKLAFDPFDKRNRETWAGNTDVKTRKLVLDKLLKRLVTEQDMPPEDSAEFTLFRRKDPAAFAAVKEFLESELSKLPRD